MSRRQIVAATASAAAFPLAATACSAAPRDEEVLRPEQFGARGDGITDDQPAFDALNRSLAARGGGTVELAPRAVYLAGKQVPGLDGYYLGPAPILGVRNVARLVVIMNGATIRFRNGLRFGSFDPRSGLPYQPNAAFFDRSHAAQIGWGIMAQGARHFEVRGGRVDCNSAGAVLGGEWGDKDRQLRHIGVAAYECEHVLIEHVEVRDSCLDGFLIEDGDATDASPPRHQIIRRSTAENCARDCLSITAGNSVLIDRCHFSRAGEAPNLALGTSFGSAPKSCLNVEGEGRVCKNIRISGCTLQAGAQSHTALSILPPHRVDGVLVESCEINGNVWVDAPNVVFRGGAINGKFSRLYGGQEVGNSQIVGTAMSDHSVDGAAVDPGMFIDLAAAGPGVLVKDSTLLLTTHSLNGIGLVVDGLSIRLRTGRANFDAGTTLLAFQGARGRNLRIVEDIPYGQRPTTPFGLGLDGAAIDGVIVNSASRSLVRAD